MRGRVEVRGEPASAAEIIAEFEAARARLDEATAIALRVAVTREPATLPARGQGELALELPAGTLLVGLALAHDSVLLDTPADRVLNRNVRGLLRGLRAQYFGTEHLVVGGRPVAWVGFDRDATGRVLLVAAIGVAHPISTTPPTTLRGRPYASLRELGDAAAASELARRILAGYEHYGLEPE